MLSPDLVSLVSPPTTTMAKTIADTPNSHALTQGSPSSSRAASGDEEKEEEDVCASEAMVAPFTSAVLEKKEKECPCTPDHTATGCIDPLGVPVSREGEHIEDTRRREASPCTQERSPGRFCHLLCRALIADLRKDTPLRRREVAANRPVSIVTLKQYCR
jgi:hypothetical protein